MTSQRKWEKGARFDLHDMRNFLHYAHLILGAGISWSREHIHVYTESEGKILSGVVFGLGSGRVYRLEPLQWLDQLDPHGWWEAMGVSRDFAQALEDRRVKYERAIEKSREDGDSIWDILDHVWTDKMKIVEATMQQAKAFSHAINAPTVARQILPPKRLGSK